MTGGGSELALNELTRSDLGDIVRYQYAQLSWSTRNNAAALCPYNRSGRRRSLALKLACSRVSRNVSRNLHINVSSLSYLISLTRDCGNTVGEL